MTIAYIGLGSNHEVEANLKRGINLLGQKVTVTAVSPVYESAPVNDSDTAPYLNAAVAIETEMQPHDIKSLLVEIEDECGRIRIDADGKKSKVVTLDFDLLLYGASVTSYEYNAKTYHLPHDDILKYAHVAIPLADIAGDFVHPETNHTIALIATDFVNRDLISRDDIRL
jgi:2-amino-4-hydroxy-6-hydroxymethyldihydropteridine diphosphokinase